MIPALGPGSPDDPTVHSERALQMEARVAAASAEAGLPTDGVGQVVRAHRAAMRAREAVPSADGDQDPTFLHPGRTILILLGDVEERDPGTLALGALAESRDLALRVPDLVAARVLGEEVATWRTLPRPDWFGRSRGERPEGAPPGGERLGDELRDEELLEALVSAPAVVLRVALSEALDHLRHAHLWRDAGERSRALELARDVFGPAAARAHPTLDRRFAWWIRRVGGNRRLFG